MISSLHIVSHLLSRKLVRSILLLGALFYSLIADKSRSKRYAEADLFDAIRLSWHIKLDSYIRFSPLRQSARHVWFHATVNFSPHLISLHIQCLPRSVIPPLHTVLPRQSCAFHSELPPASTFLAHLPVPLRQACLPPALCYSIASSNHTRSISPITSLFPTSSNFSATPYHLVRLRLSYHTKTPRSFPPCWNVPPHQDWSSTSNLLHHTERFHRMQVSYLSWMSHLTEPFYSIKKRMRPLKPPTTQATPNPLTASHHKSPWTHTPPPSPTRNPHYYALPPTPCFPDQHKYPD